MSVHPRWCFEGDDGEFDVVADTAFVDVAFYHIVDDDHAREDDEMKARDKAQGERPFDEGEIQQEYRWAQATRYEEVGTEDGRSEREGRKLRVM